MSPSRIDLVIHPDRLRILQSLAGGPRTTQEIADALPAIPKSSIYRHLKKLLDGEIIAVAETRPVKGTIEKVYALTSAARLTPEDLAGLTPEDHIRYFATYAATLLQGFAGYIENTPEPDYIRDRVGYTEVSFYASSAEFDAMQMAINQALIPLLHNPPGEGRIQRKLATLTHPVIEGANHE